MSLIQKAIEQTALELHRRERHSLRRIIVGKNVGNSWGDSLAEKGLVRSTGWHYSDWELTPLGLKVFKAMPVPEKSELHDQCVKRLKEQQE